MTSENLAPEAPLPATQPLQSVAKKKERKAKETKKQSEKKPKPHSYKGKHSFVSYDFETFDALWTFMENLNPGLKKKGKTKNELEEIDAMKESLKDVESENGLSLYTMSQFAKGTFIDNAYIVVTKDPTLFEKEISIEAFYIKPPAQKENPRILQDMLQNVISTLRTRKAKTCVTLTDRFTKEQSVAHETLHFSNASVHSEKLYTYNF